MDRGIAGGFVIASIFLLVLVVIPMVYNIGYKQGADCLLNGNSVTKGYTCVTVSELRKLEEID